MPIDAVPPPGWMRVAAWNRASQVLVVCSDVATSGHLEASDGSVSVVRTSVDPVSQQRAPFPVTYLERCIADLTPEMQRVAVHQAVQHLDRGGVLAMSADLVASSVDLAGAVAGLGMTRESGPEPDGVAVFHRTERTTVHDLLWDARRTIERITADDLAAELGTHRAPLVVDTRTHTDRCRMGVIAGSIHVPRTVLEWHLDPANGYSHPSISGFDDRLVVVCNGGYSSSLAAANLVRLGFTDVRDLVGGVRAWIHHGHPVAAPDHAHLDL